jgi:hypothetical protein
MSGCRWWMDMPSKYGSYKIVWEHRKKWSKQEGIWKRIMNSLVSYGYHKGLVNVNELSIDSSTVAAKKGRGKR